MHGAFSFDRTLAAFFERLVFADFEVEATSGRVRSGRRFSVAVVEERRALSHEHDDLACEWRARRVGPRHVLREDFDEPAKADHARAGDLDEGAVRQAFFAGAEFHRNRRITDDNRFLYLFPGRVQPDQGAGLRSEPGATGTET